MNLIILSLFFETIRNLRLFKKKNYSFLTIFFPDFPHEEGVLISLRDILFGIQDQKIDANFCEKI